MPFKILLVDDDINDRNTTISQLKRLLEDEERFDVKATADGRNAYDLVFEYKPDVIVLDIKFGSQGIKGTEICKSIRENGCEVPIILITKFYTETDDVLQGFAVGADDYVRLPCDKMEIRARILANLPQGIEEYDDYLRIDRESQRVCVKRNGEWQEVTLRPLQFRLLRELADNAGRPIEYYKLADRVWGKEEMDEGAMFKCLCELRARVEPDPHHPIYLETIRGVGYRFNGRSTREYGGSAKRRVPC
jgi:DNA-binding response OmpR family regulator